LSCEIARLGEPFQGAFLGMPHFWNFKTLKKTKAVLILNLNTKQKIKKTRTQKVREEGSNRFLL
jgi:hypothetical protein